jgi:ubiquinone/menaquinone biosynthesis C-methylase UbiE
VEFNLGKSQKLVRFASSDWHKRFQQQATWTQEFRSYLFRKKITEKNLRILEVGSGTGAFTYQLTKLDRFSVFGIDLAPERVHFAKKYDPKSYFSIADGLMLPFSDECFDITYCHYYLMWVSSPFDAIAEMVRVTKTSGRIVVFAEPDYSQRDDLPENLLEVGTLQYRALQLQGANPEIGGKLNKMFHTLSLSIEETGIYQSDPNLNEKANFQKEITILRYDLSFIGENNRISKLISKIENAYKLKKFQWSVPTHFIYGKKIRTHCQKSKK